MKPNLTTVNVVADQPVCRRLRVLIADDTATIRKSLSALISHLENVEIVGVAENGLQALESARSLNPDVITLDIRMPGLNGINVLQTIRREGSKAIVIILTGQNEAEYRRLCLELGADYFLHKTTEFEQIIEILKRAGHHCEAGISAR